ncbi:barrier-to-autointegration factor [Trichonephila clavata]|uniref:Barrier-to-autointegration factor-like protein n=1 Tax=Trichonephila clavata TaxID=2740835 RepID=A0A8X6FSU7_TRICU|nr:barrier-to-autointegration factor [Trichonephila clavata]
MKRFGRFSLNSQQLDTMTRNSQKFLDFVNSPIGNKGVDALPGLSSELCKNLRAKGYNKAWVLLGQFLLLKKRKIDFILWMKYICGANRYQAAICYQCLLEWSDMFM